MNVRHAKSVVTLVCGLYGWSVAYADQVDDYIRMEMRNQSVPGLSLAVIRNGKPIKVKAYGVANVEWDIPATTDTVYRIGSVSKQFIATTAMLLVDGTRVIRHRADGYALRNDTLTSVAATYIGGLLPTLQATRMSEETLNAFVGRYRLSVGAILTITNEGGKLRARAPTIDMNFLLQSSSAS